MGSDVLGAMIKNYINALTIDNKKDQTELTKAIGNAIEDYFGSGASPLGVILDYLGVTDPSAYWVISNYRTLSQTTYSGLFTLIDHRYAKTKSDRDTAEASKLFHIPDGFDLYIRGGLYETFSDTDIDTVTDRITITAHSITRDGTPVRFFTDDTLPSVISGLTNQSWETIFVRVIDANTIELYDTEAHAIDTSGTTGRLDFTDQGDGTHELTQQGIIIDDAFQGWQLGATDDLSGARDSWGEARDRNRAIDSSSNANYNTVQFQPAFQGGSGKLIAMNDSINGTIRQTNETRPRTGFARKIIRIL